MSSYLYNFCFLFSHIHCSTQLFKNRTFGNVDKADADGSSVLQTLTCKIPGTKSVH